MRYLRILLVCPIFFGGIAQAEKWINFNTTSLSSDSVIVSYIDVESIKNDSNMRRYWVISDFISEIVLSYKSSRNYYELDCREDRIRLLQATYFSQSMGEGQMIRRTIEPQPWVYMDRKHIHFELAKVLCK